MRSSTTVVYIEPDHANALVLQYLLDGRTDYTLHHAIDGHSGLELCRALAPDLVLTEMRLPDMSTYQVLRMLRSDAATKCVPCVVLSGDAMPGNIKQALDAGFDDYWTKPMDVWPLLQRLIGVMASVHQGFNRHDPIAGAIDCRSHGNHSGRCSATALQKFWLPA